MKLPDIKALVREQAKFIYYADGNLWYSITYSTDKRQVDDDGVGYDVPAIFEFPVPISDAEGAKFLRSDNGLFFMRWIRKHLAFLERAQSESTESA